MNKKNRIINEGGINGSGTGVVNVNSPDYKALQKAIIEHNKQRTPEQRLKIKLLSLKYQMEDYVSQKRPEKIIPTGYYLKEYLTAIGIKNKNFAKYISIEESNLSAIIRGRRRINLDMAYKLGEVFKTNPEIWLAIQNKNELFRIDQRKKLEYQKYKLEDLVKLAG